MTLQSLPFDGQRRTGHSWCLQVNSQTRGGLWAHGQIAMMARVFRGIPLYRIQSTEHIVHDSPRARLQRRLVDYTLSQCQMSICTHPATAARLLLLQMLPSVAAREAGVGVLTSTGACP